MIDTQINRVVYTGDGSSTNFAFNTVVLAQTDIVVVEETIATGALVTKSLGSDYTISGTQDSVGRYTTGVFVVAAVAPSALVKWIIYQDPPVVQSVDLTDNGLLPVESQIELPLDRLTVIAQRLKSRLTRTLIQADGDSADIGALPVKATRASKFLAFDANGNPIAAAGTSANLAPVSAFMNTLLDDADAAAAQATLGISRDGLKIAPPMPAVRDLRGARHATTTQFTLSSVRYAVLTNSSGDSVLRIAPGSHTVNALSAGPIANGRDQAGVFTNTWLNLYYIWNGTAVSVIASAAAPPTGPTLPSGYTHFAYATSVYYTTEFMSCIVHGNRVWTDVTGFTGLTSTSLVTIGSLTQQVSPIATHAFGEAGLSGTSTGGGSLSAQIVIAPRTTAPLASALILELTQFGINSTTQTIGQVPFVCPLLTAQTVYYNIATTSGTSVAGEVRIAGFMVPNGDTI